MLHAYLLTVLCAVLVNSLFLRRQIASLRATLIRMRLESQREIERRAESFARQKEAIQTRRDAGMGLVPWWYERRQRLGLSN